MITVKAETQQSGAFRQRLELGAHEVFSDMKDEGGLDTAPGPHELFDASLAACKALTAHWYAKKRGFPLERVSTVIDRDDSKEREGHYALTVTMQFHGPLTDEQRARLLDVASRCPVHKLMTSVDITIETKAG